MKQPCNASMTYCILIVHLACLQRKMLGPYYILIERRIISAMYLIRTHTQVNIFVAWDWPIQQWGLISYFTTPEDYENDNVIIYY